MIRKEVMIVLITFCLTATLFSIIPVGSQGVRDYDPWYDVTGPIPGQPDGKIDLRDYYAIGLKFGTEGDPTRNVNVTNFPLDENGNLRVSAFGKPLQLSNFTQKITVFSTEAQYYIVAYEGGIKLNSNSGFVFDFNPLGTPFNITSVYISITMFTDMGNPTLPLNQTRAWIALNGQTEYWETGVQVDHHWLTALSIPVFNSTLVDSIHQGTNKLQIIVQSYGWDQNPPWKDDRAYELSVFIEYECLA